MGRAPSEGDIKPSNAMQADFDNDIDDDSIMDSDERFLVRHSLRRK